MYIFKGIIFIRPDKSDPNQTTRNQIRIDMRKSWTDFDPNSEIEPIQNRTDPKL